MGSFFERLQERWENRGEIVNLIFGDAFRFLEENGISRAWLILFIILCIEFIYFLFETSPMFTGEKLSLKERWKLYWKDFDIVKTMAVILTPIIFLFLFAFFGIIMIIPHILVIGLWVFHFFLSTEKYIDKRQRFSFKNFQIRWMMYWKGFDFFKGGLSILIPIGMIYVAIIHQIGIAKGFR
ncbi:hypothetical protein BREVNS_1308 [Brevinematales bacterium NS]|nr:hypothetical protein BREVNS_1308 [Brevinematales bacterium NS]